MKKRITILCLALMLECFSCVCPHCVFDIVDDGGISPNEVVSKDGGTTCVEFSPETAVDNWKNCPASVSYPGNVSPGWICKMITLELCSCCEEL